MNRLLLQVASSFDGGRNASAAEPERFYHGLVLGLIAELEDRYFVRSNRESGFGRYDVMLEPVDAGKPAFVLEFKVFNPRRESSLEEAADAGLKQIEEKQYVAELAARGFSAESIHRYALAFEGKRVLVKEG